MRTIVIIIAFTLAGLAGMAQTNQPLPPDAQPLTALTYLSPSDSTVWLYNERSSLAINVGVWADVVELFNQKWSNTQIDSAIADNLSNYLQYGDNVSSLDNDAGYITIGDVPAPPVTSVAGKTGDILLNKSDVNLAEVDNTSDIDKPVSTAQQAALNLKLDFASTYIEDFNLPPLRGFGYTDNVTTNQPYSAFATAFAFSRTGAQRATLWYDVAGSGRLFINRSTNSGASWTRNEIWHSGSFTPPSVFTRSVNGLVPAPGGSGTTRFMREDGTWAVPSGGGGGGTATDLSIQNRTSTTLQIGSSTGTAATVPAATTSLAGLMSAADKTALNSFNPSSYVSTATSINTGSHLSGGGQLTGDRTINFAPTLSEWINDSGGNPRLQFQGGPNSNYMLRLSHPTGRFSFQSSSGVTVSFIDYAGVGSFSGLILPGANTSVVRGDGSVGSVPSHTQPFSTITARPTTLSGYGITDNIIRYNTGAYPQIEVGSSYVRTPSGGILPDVGGGSTTARVGTSSYPFAEIYGNVLFEGGVSLSSKYTPLSRTINGKALSANVTLTAADVGAAVIGTGSTQVRNNTQLDSRYLQSDDNTVLRTTGNQTKAGTLGVTNIHGSSTTASSSIPTNAQSLFTASVSSNTTYTLTNLTGSPRHIQIMVTNTGSSDIFITFNGAKLSVSQSNRVDQGHTAIFTFLVNNGSAYGTKTLFAND